MEHEPGKSECSEVLTDVDRHCFMCRKIGIDIYPRKGTLFFYLCSECLNGLNKP